MRRLLLAAAVLLAVYTAIAASSYPIHLARSRPDVASFFRPQWFNFSATYTDGPVMGFRVGQSRADFKVTLLQPAGGSVRVGAACGRPPSAPSLAAAESFLPVADNAKVSQLLGLDVVCLFYRQPNMAVVVSFDADTVRTVELSVVRTEAP